jgi:hypothetical protein
VRAVTKVAGPHKDGRLPNFVVIGAAKAGTTSLHYYLSLHPQIFMAAPKEPRFFVDCAPPRGTWCNGLGWYRSLFRSDKPLCGEASTQYSQHPFFDGVADRMHSVVPEAKLLYLVRDPVQRVYSHFLMGLRKGKWSGSFEDFIASDDSEFVIQTSCYASQLRRYLTFYPQDRILVIKSADLERHRTETLHRVFSFLGADAQFRSPLFHRRRNVGEEQPVPTAQGVRLRESRVMRMAERVLHPGLFYHSRNFLLRPFSKQIPTRVASSSVPEELRLRFEAELAELRALSGCDLSLGAQV